jgi:hypothetical protein
MQAYICVTCGVQYESSDAPPQHCKICEDDRQYISPSGQTWSTLEALNLRHKNIFELIAPNVYAIYTTPSFAIGQRAHLIISPSGNILWDCITVLDATTIALTNALGGIKAIAISHPHYFSTIAEWSKAFGDVPVYINGRDEQWLARTSESIKLWHKDELELWDGMKLIRCGGHFPGASVLYGPANGGSLFVGDTIQVAPDLKTVSFMYSYPNLVPLPKKDILDIKNSIAGFRYNAMYGAFGRYIRNNAMQSMEFSIDRYLSIYA